MGISSIKGTLAAAFTATIMAISPMANAATIDPENTQNHQITSTTFEAGQCYSQIEMNEYYAGNGEVEIMELDKTGTVNTRSGLQTFNNEYTLTADHDSWTLIAEGSNNESCILLQGTDLDYVSIDNQFFTQVSADIQFATTERERALENIANRYRETVFLTGTTNDGRNIDLTTSLRGGWSLAVSQADGSGFTMAYDGFTHSLTEPNFQDTFDLFHPDSLNASHRVAELHTPGL